MLKLRVLKAKNGDSILVSWLHEGMTRNLLIDGGSGPVYKTRQRKGSLYNALEEIKASGQRIDKTVVTHVDDDHIGGVLNAFKSGELLEELCDQVWFNSGRAIKQAYDNDTAPDNELELERANLSDGRTSIRQGVSLEDRLTQLQIWDGKIIEAGYVSEFFGAKITVLSPSRVNLEKLLFKWEREAPSSLTSGGSNDYDKSLEELIATDKYISDSSPHNGSSIALLFEFGSKKLLLLGDAFDHIVASTICQIKDQNGNYYSENNKLEVEYVKLSHHGSEYNTSNNLLDIIKCQNYIISTDGSAHNLPNKRTIARILEKVDEPNIIFNYPQLIDRIFTQKEIEKLSMSGIKLSDSDDVINVG
ncbi:ComEC/Rec2 family competence protein [Vibrio harveyi]|uniref:ComEC/Rec2 family competence protein n=1 Tax=Vibrio harveyi TaxID=669 RepID=UPI00034A99A1|nr:MBL fold metallo-hydrolase [Vibrio harveyi]